MQTLNKKIYKDLSEAKHFARILQQIDKELMQKEQKLKKSIMRLNDVLRCQLMLRGVKDERK